MIEGYTLPRNAEMENVFYRHSDHRSMIQNPLPTSPMCHSGLRPGIPFIDCQCVTPASEPESPTNSVGFKTIQFLTKRLTMRL